MLMLLRFTLTLSYAYAYVNAYAYVISVNQPLECSIKQLRVLLLSLDRILVHCRVTPAVCRQYPFIQYTWVERDNVEYSFLLLCCFLRQETKFSEPTLIKMDVASELIFLWSFKELKCYSGWICPGDPVICRLKFY